MGGGGSIYLYRNIQRKIFNLFLMSHLPKKAVTLVKANSDSKDSNTLKSYSPGEGGPH